MKSEDPVELTEFLSAVHKGRCIGFMRRIPALMTGRDFGISGT